MNRDTPRYIRDALVHFANPETYQIISEAQDRRDSWALKWKIFEWTIEHRKALSKQEVAFIQKKLDKGMDEPFRYFHLLYKLHKTPISTRPVYSDCGSLPHAMRQWVDEQLQPIMQARETYIKDSFSFKSEISKFELPPGASIFTYKLF